MLLNFLSAERMILSVYSVKNVVAAAVAAVPTAASVGAPLYEQVVSLSTLRERSPFSSMSSTIQQNQQQQQQQRRRRQGVCSSVSRLCPLAFLGAIFCSSASSVSWSFSPMSRGNKSGSSHGVPDPAVATMFWTQRAQQRHVTPN
mmetsp:Transcript_12321/g.33609  ORF Transcript_12321/g.33609 Transcript_12321/m.33609 type:complete len:145 (-) Transcript_12321:470-904(-)